MKKLSFIIFVISVCLSVISNDRCTTYAQEQMVEEDIANDDEYGSSRLENEQGSIESHKPSDATTTILFTAPATNHQSFELPGGQKVEFLVGFANKGKSDFILDSLETSLRYPLDFKFYIQNFTALTINKIVKPNHEATIQYSFIPSESYAGRPFGLNVNLNYKNLQEEFFNEAVFNETVQIVEIDEGLDGETVFLYVFLAACVILTLVGGQQLLSSLGKKSRMTSSRKQVVEVGTSNPNNVDFDWLPKDIVNRLNKSPKDTKLSPRQKKTK